MTAEIQELEINLGRTLVFLESKCSYRMAILAMCLLMQGES